MAGPFAGSAQRRPTKTRREVGTPMALFFFLDDLVDFAGAVEKQSRFERKHQ